MFRREIEAFLEEDIGYANYEEIIIPDKECEAEIRAKESGIIAGLEEAEQIFEYLSVETTSRFKDGDAIKSGDVVMNVRGKGVDILRAERLVLNFLGRMSGIATLTNAFIKEARKVNKNVKIAGTRKTTPGFRKYEKKAIMIGGGDPHRGGLYDAVIIKDNYIRLMGMEEALRRARRKSSFVRKIEVEVTTVEDAMRAAELGADIIMFDNMTAEAIKESIRLLEEKGYRERLILEASGDINMENIKEFAATGVDIISIGMLTHSAKWLNFSLDVIKPLHHAP
ncbi:MAG: carboxylating nicotinate-nucleotide diphosphorylase [Candidatus Methanospirareceae archaeon]